MNHDIDRTLNELEMEGEWEAPLTDDVDTDELEWEAGELGEFEALEFEDEYDEEAQAADSPLTEEEEMEFAMELLEVTSDEELEQFLGRLVKRAARGIRKVAKRGRRFLRSRVGRRLVKVAKGVAKRALPMAGRAVGTAFGGPIGGAIGGGVAGAAGRALGLELEGLSPEDQEFEVARHVVRFTAGATNAAVEDNERGAPSAQALRRGVVAAAQRHAPGLLRGSRQGGGGTTTSSGRWIRRGNRIILSGV
ncbi:hypothetical protein [Litchfieldella rifensis]|uniref:Uncharacterized protein n=1 Tax=Litchfieldella rifensis TaxID=762643 RepID=A0ABV7LLS4_9GAMM